MREEASLLVARPRRRPRPSRACAATLTRSRAFRQGEHGWQTRLEFSRNQYRSRFSRASRKSTAGNGLKSVSCGDSSGPPPPAVFLTPSEAHVINPTAFAIHHLQFTIYKETARAGARRNAL